MAIPEGLSCVLCGRRFDPKDPVLTCPDCGLDGTLDVTYDYEAAAKVLNRASLAECERRDLWRYMAVLPVSGKESIPDLAVGWTPLYRSKRLAEKWGVREVFIKDDGRNPTGSLKDRASAVGVMKALEARQKVVSCASTGNAASSLAGFAAVAGLSSVIFVPEEAPSAKIAQLLVYGAEVVLVRGGYEKAFDLATQAIDTWGWYNRNCAINPYLVEGKKTCAMEVAEQLGWDLPDVVFVSVGDGCIVSGLYKGFFDLLRLGITDRIPRIVGVQAEGAAPIWKAFRNGSDRVEFAPAQTVADSISVGSPRNWAKALRAVRESFGEMITVTDDEILSAIPELARSTGVFGEPAGVTGFAGFRKMAEQGLIGKNERVAVIVTGNGLKDIEGAKKSVGGPVVVDADLEELRKVLGDRLGI
ncbi:MAG: threonine synthase [Synergistales bacterium]|nr:threonine synthase [Synergistales bacterium]